MSEKCEKSKSDKLKEIFSMGKATRRKSQDTRTTQIDKSLNESFKSGRAYRRNLRQRRKGTGIAISEETVQDGSDEDDQSALAKKIAHFNQIFSTNEADAPRDDLYIISEKLQEEILLKDKYIQSLEAKIRQLEQELAEKAAIKT